MKKSTQKLFLVRHGESEYNRAVKLFYEQVKKNPDMKNEDLEDLRYSDKLLDAPLSLNGIEQCIKCHESLNNLDFDLVLTSPLRRALETTFNCIKNRPKKPKVLVVPLAREAAFVNCDLGTNIKESINMFPEFDFSLLNHYEHKSLFWMYDLQNEKKKQMILSEISSECLTEKDYDEKAKYITLDWMRKNKDNDCLENLEELNSRIKLFKEFLADLVPRENPNCKPIVIFGHSRMFAHFQAAEFDEKGKILGEFKWIENCEIREYDFSFPCTY